jgi:hypothetical protein
VKRGGLVVCSELPPARSGAAAGGEALVRLLRRAGYRRTRADWPLPEAIEAHLAAADLAVYHVSNDLDDREIYELAISWPGLVILPDLALDRLVLGLIRARDPLGVEGGREALAAASNVSTLAPQSPLSVPWCAHLVRRARGVVVHSAFAARYLEAMWPRIPVPLIPRGSDGFAGRPFGSAGGWAPPGSSAWWESSVPRCRCRWSWRPRPVSMPIL